MREIHEPRQIKGEPRRRWFYTATCELVVWLGRGDVVVGFQFTYDKDTVPHVLTWQHPDKFMHTGVDTGEVHPLKPKASPILVANGLFDCVRIGEIFKEACGMVPSRYVDEVARRLTEIADLRG
mgnify:FL=1